MSAAATLISAWGLVSSQFGALCAGSASDACALSNVVYGLDDGNNYGRYFYGQNPLVSYQVAATSLGGLIAQSSAQQAAVAAAMTAANAAASDTGAFGPALIALVEAVRQVCANPADAVRLLTDFTRFQAIVGSTVVPTVDGLGAEIYFLTWRAVLLIRNAAAGSLIIASATYRPNSQQDAANLSTQVSDSLDQIELLCGDLFDDATMRAIEAGRVAVVTDLLQRGANLAPVVNRRLQRAMPAKVLAYRFYQDAARAADLVARNDAPDPAFMPLNLETLAS